MEHLNLKDDTNIVLENEKLKTRKMELFSSINVKENKEMGNLSKFSYSKNSNKCCGALPYFLGQKAFNNHIYLPIPKIEAPIINIAENHTELDKKILEKLKQIKDNIKDNNEYKDMTKKPKRKRANNLQVSVLLEVLNITSFPTTLIKSELSSMLGMTERAIQIWFQNKRQVIRNPNVRKSDKVEVKQDNDFTFKQKSTSFSALRGLANIATYVQEVDLQQNETNVFTE